MKRRYNPHLFCLSFFFLIKKEIDHGFICFHVIVRIISKLGLQNHITWITPSMGLKGRHRWECS